MKRFLSLLTACCLLVSFAAAAPAVTSGEAMLMDDRGQVLYETVDENSAGIAGGLTKLMTALLTFETYPDLTVPVKANGTAQNNLRDNPSMQLKDGETLTAEQLLYAMLVGGANDAANALAEAIAGDQQAFVRVMSERAEYMGMLDTSFANAHGLAAEHSWSTAHDIALLLRELSGYPAFLEITGTKQYVIDPNQWTEGPRVFQNPLKMDDERVRGGMMTSEKGENGWNLAVIADSENGERRIAVTIGAKSAEDSEADAAALLDYGFDGFVRTGFSKEELAGLVESGLEIPADAVTFLLPEGMTVEDVHVEETDGVLIFTAAWDGEVHELTRLTLGEPAPAPEPEPVPEEKPAPAPEPETQPVPALPMGLLYALIGIGAVAVLVIVFCVHRNRRVKKQRAEIRRMRERK